MGGGQRLPNIQSHKEDSMGRTIVEEKTAKEAVNIGAAEVACTNEREL